MATDPSLIYSMSPGQTTPSEELRRRIQAAQNRMGAAGIDALLIVQNADLFYFAGTTQQAHLYIPASGKPLLMARKDYDRACSESALERIVPLVSTREIPGILNDHGYSQP